MHTALGKYLVTLGTNGAPESCWGSLVNLSRHFIELHSSICYMTDPLSNTGAVLLSLLLKRMKMTLMIPLLPLTHVSAGRTHLILPSSDLCHPFLAPSRASPAMLQSQGTGVETDLLLS